MEKRGRILNLTYKNIKEKTKEFLAANHLLNMSENIKKKEGKYYGIKKGVPRNIKSA